MLDLDRPSWTITIPASSRRTIKKVIGDVEPSLSDDTFAARVRAANAELNAELSYVRHQSMFENSVETGEADPKLVRALPPF